LIFGTFVGIALACLKVVWFGSSKGASMIGKTKTRVYARLGLFLAVFAGMAACALVPSASSATSVPPNTLEPTLTLISLVLSPTPTATSQPDAGWQAEYYNNEILQEPVTLTRMESDSIFDWKDGSPDPALPIDHFSVRLTRCVDLEERYYTFHAYADDYIRVLVDDIQVLEAPLYARIERPFAVSAGRHCIKLEYKEGIGYAHLDFSFQPGESFMVADASAAWQGEYFNNKDFIGPATYTRNDAAPQFNWQEGNPAPGIPVDGFSVRWTRCLELEARAYVFTARADEYVRVLVDDVPVLEAPLSVNAEAPYDASADRHCIKVEYREEAGTANVYFAFQ
jgi:hypothetical protein